MGSGGWVVISPKGFRHKAQGWTRSVLPWVHNAKAHGILKGFRPWRHPRRHNPVGIGSTRRLHRPGRLHSQPTLGCEPQALRATVFSVATWSPQHGLRTPYDPFSSDHARIPTYDETRYSAEFLQRCHAAPGRSTRNCTSRVKSTSVTYTVQPSGPPKQRLLGRVPNTSIS